MKRTELYPSAVAWSAEDEAFIAVSFDLPGCRADGQTKAEALANLEVVIEEWIETAESLGRPIPEPSNYASLEQSQAVADRELHEHYQRQVAEAVRISVEQMIPSLVSALRSGDIRLPGRADWIHPRAAGVVSHMIPVTVARRRSDS